MIRFWPKPLKTLLLITAVVAVLLVGGIYAGLYTTTGARLVFSIAQNQLGDALDIEEITGVIGSGLELESIGFRSEDMILRAEKVRLALAPEFFPFAIQIEYLEIASLEIRQGEASVDTGEPAESTAVNEILSSLALPFPVNLSSLDLDLIEFFDNNGALVFSASRFSSSMSLFDALDVGHLTIEAEGSAVELSGSFGLSAPFPISLNSKADIALDEDATGGLDSIEIQASLHGDLENSLEIDLTTIAPEVTISGELQELISDPSWNLSLVAPALSWPPAPDSNQSNRGQSRPDIIIESIAFNSEGGIHEYTLETDAVLNMPDMDAIDLELRGDGDETGIAITAFSLASKQLNLASEGKINWANEAYIKLNSMLGRFDPSAFLSEWPVAHPLQGRFEMVLGEGGLELPVMLFQARDTTMHLDATASVDLDSGLLEATVSWIDIVWPIASEYPDLLSPAGDIVLSGSPDDWKLSGDTTLQTADLPAGHLRLEAAGDRESAAMTLVDGRVLGGELTGLANVHWTGKMGWAAALDAKGINTGILLPDWPGSISTRLEVEGSMEPFRLSLDIKQLSGEIRERAFTGSGQLDMLGKQQLEADIQLASGSSNLQLQGKLFDTEGMIFSTNIADLGFFLPTGSGFLQASGMVSLVPGKPRLRLDLAGEQLGWNDLSLEKLSIRNSSEVSADTVAGLQLEANQLVVDSETIDNISLDIDAGQTRQSVQLSAVFSGLEFSTHLNGALEDWQRPVESGWSGNIESIVFSNGDKLSLHLEKPAPLQLSANKAQLDDACIITGESSSVCINTRWQNKGDYSAAVLINDVPLSLAHAFLDNDLTFSQRLKGEISLQGASDHPPSGRAHLQMSPGVINSATDTDFVLESGESTFDLTLDRGKLVTTNIDLPFPGNGEIDIDLQLPDLSAGKNAQIDGHAVITLNDLGIFNPLLPVIDQVAGSFEATLDARGNALQPAVTGQLAIANGLIQHDASGLRLSEIRLSGNLVAGGKSQLSGGFKAKEGAGVLTADIDLSDPVSPMFEMTLTGDNLTLLDSPSLTLLVEPDIQLGWNDGTIEINGRILIPQARIAPVSVPASIKSESDDLIIVSGDIAETEDEENADSGLAIRGDLEIALGDEVELDLSLAVAQLDGSVIFSWQDDILPMANGHYGLEGQIHALGQLLQISQGRIAFPNVPANNPHFDIRAERQIFGNSEIRRAGLLIAGTAKRPIIEPYTDPITTRERAQTLLITGSDFNMEQGVGAIDVGTYIAPRVFVSYGIGVFEDENVISLRYDLGRNWGIKATSGQRSSGVDINYVIER
jgi:translocation and assembly module TamB